MIYIACITTTSCFGTKVPSSGSYYNKSVRANLLIYVLFIVISLIKTLFTISILYILYILCESLHQDSNDNGVRIVTFATSKNLLVKSTMFLHQDIHKYTRPLLMGRLTSRLIIY